MGKKMMRKYPIDMLPSLGICIKIRVRIAKADEKDAMARALKISHREDKPRKGREMIESPQGRIKATINRAKKKDLKYSTILPPEVRISHRFSLS